jgi:hypothetical protein
MLHSAHLRALVDSERAQWADPVLRVKDEMDMHAVTGGYGYAVFSMQDGRPLTHDLYPSRARARAAGERQSQDHLLILEVQPDGMPYREADAVLRYERVLNSVMRRSPDSLETEENSGSLSMPRTAHDQRRMIRQLASGAPLVPDDVPYGNFPAAFQRKA